MDYALAKELKEAGFPFRKNEVNVYVRHPETGEENVPKGMMFVDIDPTLEELIEACGENFSILRHFAQGIWIAYAEENGDGAGDGLNGEGSTPLVSSARLWLALNKK